MDDLDDALETNDGVDDLADEEEEREPIDFRDEHDRHYP